MRPMVMLLLLSACSSRPLPVLGALGDFSLVDQSGRRYGSAELRGQVWVANFIFTRCTTVCPLFTEKMRALQGRTGPSVRLVSFSVDPDYDRPPVLAAYARAHGADPSRWSFLTGDLEPVRRVVTDGLKMYMERNPDQSDPGAAVFHGTHFVLVDPQLRIRGYYDSNDADATARVIRDAARLAKE